jgi:hypothetical protein
MLTLDEWEGDVQKAVSSGDYEWQLGIMIDSVSWIVIT